MPGDGDGSEHGNGEGTKINFAEARAAFGEPPDRVDRIALFCAEQAEMLRRAIVAHSEAMHDKIELMRDQFRLFALEIALLKAEQRDTHEVVVAPARRAATLDQRPSPTRLRKPRRRAVYAAIDMPWAKLVGHDNPAR
jgi:hypothetical protein